MAGSIVIFILIYPDHITKLYELPGYDTKTCTYSDSGVRLLSFSCIESMIPGNGNQAAANNQPPGLPPGTVKCGFAPGRVSLCSNRCEVSYKSDTGLLISYNNVGFSLFD